MMGEKVNGIKEQTWPRWLSGLRQASRELRTFQEVTEKRQGTQNPAMETRTRRNDLIRSEKVNDDYEGISHDK